MIILVDQDGPLADFEEEWLNRWREKYPDEFYIDHVDREDFYIHDQYPKHLRAQVDAVYHAPGFYRNLPVVKGCQEAMFEMLDMGIDVRICTAPLPAYQNCVLEKYEWIEEHLGMEFVLRTIIAPDKTLVRGDILLDDKPTVKGSMKPTWEHVLYTSPYNRRITDQKRLTWDNWKEVLLPMLKK